MYSSRGYQLTQAEYNYLLPVLRTKLLYSNDKYYFTGNSEDLTDMLNRLKGLYDYYDELKSFNIYRCTVDRSINPFRNEIGVCNL